jgi:hypothetical protein
MKTKTIKTAAITKTNFFIEIFKMSVVVDFINAITTLLAFTKKSQTKHQIKDNYIAKQSKRLRNFNNII